MNGQSKVKSSRPACIQSHSPDWGGSYWDRLVRHHTHLCLFRAGPRLQPAIRFRDAESSGAISPPNNYLFFIWACVSRPNRMWFLGSCQPPLRITFNGHESRSSGSSSCPSITCVLSAAGNVANMLRLRQRQGQWGLAPWHTAESEPELAVRARSVGRVLANVTRLMPRYVDRG